MAPDGRPAGLDLPTHPWRVAHRLLMSRFLVRSSPLPWSFSRQFKFLRFPTTSLSQSAAIVLHGRAQKAHLNYRVGCRYCMSSSFLHKQLHRLDSKAATAFRTLMKVCWQHVYSRSAEEILRARPF